jgi:eukaryotic-like serine/threonine-protein kinase
MNFKISYKKLKPYLMSAGILLAVFIFAFFFMDVLLNIITGHKNEVDVPDLSGMNYELAVKKCKNLNLYLEDIERIHNVDIEKGRIISQNPHTGIKTKKFRTVKVVVSEGPEMVRVPFLDNLTASQAKLRLENVGLFLGDKKYRYSEDIVKNNVLYSLPAADELVPKKSKTDIYISLGNYSAGSSKDSKWKNLLDKAGD